MKNLRTEILRSSIFPRSGNVKIPIRVMTPIEMKLIKFTKSLLSSDVFIVFYWIHYSWRAVRELRVVIPFA